MANELAGSRNLFPSVPFTEGGLSRDDDYVAPQGVDK